MAGRNAASGSEVGGHGCVTKLWVLCGRGSMWKGINQSIGHEFLWELEKYTINYKSIS